MQPALSEGHYPPLPRASDAEGRGELRWEMGYQREDRLSQESDDSKIRCLLNVADQAFAEVTLIIPTNDLGIPFRPFGMSLSRLFLAKFEGMGAAANTQNGFAGFDERSDHCMVFSGNASADADNEQVGLGNEESVG